MNTFSEIVLQGPFMLAKGFLLGFLGREDPEGKYFFHRKAGIRRETFKEMLKELFELDDHTHICLESSLVEPFVKAAELYTKITGYEIKSIKPISKGWFNFSFEIYNENCAAEAKSILTDIPDSIELVDYVPYEEKDMSARGVEGYAPLHDFISRGRGKLRGSFAEIMEIYLKIKRSEICDSIVCSEVFLEFDKE